MAPLRVARRDLRSHTVNRQLRGLVAVVALLTSAGCHDDSSAPAPEAPDPDRPLVIALHEEPRDLDPHRGTDLVSSILLANVFEPLVDFGPGSRIEPCLAERWSNPDDRTWRLEIREDVHFHDGRPLTARDVFASLERARDLEGTRVASHLSRVTEIRATSGPESLEGDPEHTPRFVEIRTDEPTPLFLNGLTQIFIVPESYDGDSEKVGTGPYRWKSQEAGTYTLEASPDYRDGPPTFAHAIFEVVADPDERLRRLIDGSLDLAGRFVAAKASPVLSASATVRRVIRSSLQVSMLLLHPGKPPFDDLRVRQAVDLGLDRQALAVRSAGLPHGQLVGPDVFGHDPRRDAPRYDPMEARRLLAEAGHPDGIDLVLGLGRDLNLEMLAEQLAEARVRVQLDPRPFPELVAGLEDGSVSFAYLSVVANTGDALDHLEALAHSREGRYGSSNWLELHDDTLDELIERAGATLKLEDRQRFLQQALKRLDEHKVILPLISPSDTYGIRSTLLWTPRADGRILAADVRRASSLRGSP